MCNYHFYPLLSDLRECVGGISYEKSCIFSMVYLTKYAQLSKVKAFFKQRRITVKSCSVLCESDIT